MSRIQSNGTGLAVVDPSIGGAISQVQYEFEEVKQMAEAVSKSGLFGGKTAPQILTLMLLAQAEGLPPIKAMMMYHIIENQPSMRADTMQAKFQQAGGHVRWLESTATVCRAEFTHPVCHPEPFPVNFTLDEFVKSGVTSGRDGTKKNWRATPAAMLRARAISAGIRAVLPGVIMGIYTEDEIETAETPNVIETTARTALVDKLKSKLVKPAAVVHESEVVHPTPAETAAALKQHEETKKAAPSEPQSEWGKWIAESVDAFNVELEKLADKHPDNMKFRDRVRPQQVMNHIVNEGVADGSIEKAAIETGGKRVNKKVAAILQSIWDTDPGDLMASTSDYLAAKVIPQEAPEPGSDG
jgi:hypothetical protein